LSERISVSTKELQGFLADNQQLMERYEKMLNRLTVLDRLNKELEEKQRQTEAKLKLIEQRSEGDIQKADETLRKARATITRLIKETDLRLTGL
jgi:predicted  nucleic acid-binding Zn-ribbon protein